ncbi:MAG: hypothetical protein Kow0060_20860 [Methylohalobius crimeensis]
MLLMDKLLDCQPAPVVVFDREGHIVRFNKACESATGYDFGEMRGSRVWLEMIPPEEREEVTAVFDALQAGKAPLRHENHWLHKDGSKRLYSWNNTVLKDASGEVKYIIGSGVDITEQRKAELDARRHLEEASRLQRLQTVSELANLFAHEINQPLGTIAMFAEASRKLLDHRDLDLDHRDLDKDRLDENLRQIAQQTMRAGEIIRRMRRFVNGKKIEAAPLALNPLLESTCSLIRPKAMSLGIRLSLDLDDELPEVLGVDIYLEQIALNLLRNAIEAIYEAGMENGRIRIQTRRCGHMARITFYDSGPGVGAEVAEHLFEPFYSTKNEGLGVGLSISRSLIEASGGSLWAEFGSDKGIFHLEVPLAS